MSKNKNQETAVSETAETPMAETPATEISTAKLGKTKTDFVCPACKHTAGVNIGAPYMNGEEKLQLVKCVKCHHIMTVLLS